MREHKKMFMQRTVSSLHSYNLKIIHVPYNIEHMFRHLKTKVQCFMVYFYLISNFLKADKTYFSVKTGKNQGRKETEKSE